MSLLKLWNSFPPIASLMPIKLPNGSVVEEIETTCSDCHDLTVPQADMHGEVEVTVLGAKLRMISRCPVCRKFSFMSGDILLDEGSWYLAFPPPGTPMVNPWTGEVYPMVKRGVA